MESKIDGNPSTADDIVMYYADEVLHGEITTDKLADKAVTATKLGTDVQNSIAPLTDAEINDIWNNA